MIAPMIVVCGATASGKTDLAVHLANHLKTEIISADSAQVYCGLDKGTAKPTAEERALAPHRMIDVVSPSSNYSVGDYRDRARKEADELWKLGKIPVVCGGTGFYVKSLLYDFTYGGASGNAEIRKNYEELLLNQGKDALFEILRQKDPQSADVLHPNDVMRVIRALEIYDVTGTPKSAQKDSELAVRPYLAYCLEWDRAELYDRINRRVDWMLQNGLVEEVQGLLASGVSKNAQSMQAIGYKEVVAYLDGAYDYGTMSDVIKQNTRNYAKRQLTFFKKLNGLKYLKATQGVEANAKIVLQDLEKEKWI